MTAVASSVAKAVITVTAAGNDNYLAGSKSYTLYVDQGIITLDPGAGTGGTTTIYHQSNTNVWLDNWNGVTMTPGTNPITVPRRDGYDFAGYYADANSTTALIGANAYITSAGITAAKAAKSNITWVAKWNLKTYKITYNLDGGTNNVSNPATYSIESDEIVFMEPTRKFYTFGGWYLDSNFTQSITSIPAGSTGD
ncbi:MAG: InlB B-repeat-containing protein, partial [Alphaproteobacteria bacterium]|nr:InlB B-repeat-containing protein [Alphaproteobacteria bacterium]